MEISDKIIERICKVFGSLEALEKKGVEFVSSGELGRVIGATSHTIRKDISLLGVTGYTRRGYEVKGLKTELGRKLKLSKTRKACIVGLGRLGTALLDYEKFKEDGFEIVAGFDCSINKIERLRTSIDIFSIERLEEIIKARGIELGIIAVPEKSAQSIADKLVEAGVKGILNFSPQKIFVPEKIMYQDMDFTSALRFIAVSLEMGVEF